MEYMVTASFRTYFQHLTQWHVKCIIGKVVKCTLNQACANAKDRYYCSVEISFTKPFFCL